jgi:hypothetical protein
VRTAARPLTAAPAVSGAGVCGSRHPRRFNERCADP